jgi:hypothetical protein
MCARLDKLTPLYMFALVWLLLPACATSDVEDPLEPSGVIVIPQDMGTLADMTLPPTLEDMRVPPTEDMRATPSQDMPSVNDDMSPGQEDLGVDMRQEPPLDMEMARPCQADNQCVIGSYCDLEQGVCASDCLEHEDCPPGWTCEDTRGRCEDHATDCGNDVCESFEDCEICPADCGCGPNQDCDKGVCICQDACAPGESECNAGGTRTCGADEQGCLEWSATSPCQGSCMNGMCSCMAACGGSECGMDGCGGSCGACTFACGASDLCTRQLTINYVETSCGADCQDTFDPTDPFLKLTIAGQTYSKDEGARDRCGATRTAENWVVGGATQTFTYSQLQQVTVEVYDADTFNSDDLCARWTNVDLTAHGTQTLVSSDGLVRVSLRINK